MPRYKVGDELEFSMPGMYRGQVLEIIQEGAEPGAGDVYRVGIFRAVATLPEMTGDQFIVRDDTNGLPETRVVPHAIMPVPGNVP